MSQQNYCLFSTPFSFIGNLRQKCESIMPTTFKEVWYKDELTADADLVAWIVNPGQRFTIDDKILDLFPNLQVVITPSTGKNHIDVKACRKRGIAFYSLLDDRLKLETISASAEFTFLLLLNALKRMDSSLKEVTERRWRTNEDAMRGFELYGKKVGIVGLGRIGRRMARWCRAFDAKVSYYDPYVDSDEYPSQALEKIFAESDAVCICPALTEETEGMINKNLLKRMKTNACLVNTARGEVINQDDLIAVLEERKDLRIGLDVIVGEVTNTHLDSPLLKMHDSGQIVLTPHIAGATYDSQYKAADIAVGLLKRHFAAKPAAEVTKG